MADTWSDLSARVGIATGDMDGAAAIMDRLAKVADRTYSSTELTVESFIRNSTVLKELGKTTSQQLDFTEALNNALVVSGAKGDRAAMIQEALGRAMAGGALRGQELNTVIQVGGRVAEVLAEQLGVGTNQLRRLGEEGKITSQVIFDALVKRMEQLGEQSDKMPATIADGFGRIRNAMLQLVGVYDQTNGLSEGFAKALVAVAVNLKTVAKVAILAGASLATAFSTSILGLLLSVANVIRTTLVGAVLALGVAVRANPIFAVGGLAATALVTLTTYLVEFGNDTQKIGDTTISVGNTMIAVWTTISQSLGIAKDAAWGFLLTLKNIATLNFKDVVSATDAMGASISDRIAKIQGAWGNITNTWQTTTTKSEQTPKASTALTDQQAKALKQFQEQLLQSQQQVELARQDLALQNASALVQDKARGAMELRQQMEQEALKLYGDRDAYDKKHYLQLLAEKDQLAEINNSIRAGQVKSDVAFQNAQLGRTPIEQAVYEKMQSAGLLENGKIVDEQTASVVRLGEQYKRAMDVQKDFASTFLHDMVSGKSAVESLGDALDRLADKILDNSLDTLFAGLGTSTASKGLFGGNILPGILHSGGIAGNDNYPHRAVSPAIFANAPRYHGGGIAGLKPDEVPAILQRGERVVPKGARAAGGGVSISVPVSISADGADPSQLARLTAQVVSLQQTLPKTIVSTIQNAKSRNLV
ncbi:tape measure protein [Hyphomicrobium sp. DY-1]|uniref:tape measure protein n=1 Tax=Hyphomicrobium sp. DY-1 TaxID=3075650 RepID=UPI0039C492E8